MARFSDPELCLINQWADALLLEGSIKTARKKYEALFDEVLERVQKKHPDLTEREARIHKGHGTGIGKPLWRTKPGWYISGFWIDANSLINLISDDQEAPFKAVFINGPHQKLDMTGAEKSLSERAMSIFDEQEFRSWTFEASDKQVLFWRPLDKPRQELLQMLLNEDGRAFIDYMVEQFESLVPFMEVMDAVYLNFEPGN